MSRTRETIDRQSWEAMLQQRDADDQKQLRDELLKWEGGDTCEKISVSLDSMGRLDSESSPQPGFRFENDDDPSDHYARY